jgi:hypothetical protein
VVADAGDWESTAGFWGSGGGGGGLFVFWREVAAAAGAIAWRCGASWRAQYFLFSDCDLSGFECWVVFDLLVVLALSPLSGLPTPNLMPPFVILCRIPDDH